MTERSRKKEKVFRTKENDNVVFRNGNPVLVAQPLTVVRALTSNGGARVLATPPTLNPNSDEFEACKTPMIKVNDEPQEEDVKPSVGRRSMLPFDDFLKATNTQVVTVDESMKSMEVESTIPKNTESADVDVVYETQESVKTGFVDESLKSTEVELPIVQSGNVRVQGRCIATPYKLEMMQEIMLLVSFYVHQSVFLESVDTSWRLEACGHINSAAYPLLTLLNMLEIEPYRKADFTPEEMKARKRILKLDSDEASVLPVNKRRKGISEPLPEPNKNEQALSESALNKLVGAAEVFDLEEKKAPTTLMCSLKPYQSQALYWMTEIEKGADDENADRNLHPCWSAYNICNGTIYVNIFTGEAAKKFPQATQRARGGVSLFWRMQWDLESSRSKLSRPNFEPNKGYPDEKDVGFLKDSEMGGSGSGVGGSNNNNAVGSNSGMQELTLSYLCGSKKLSLADKDVHGDGDDESFLNSFDKMSQKGKEVMVSENSNQDGKWVERDFLSLSETREDSSKRSVEEEDVEKERESVRDKKPKLETLNLLSSMATEIFSSLVLFITLAAPLRGFPFWLHDVPGIVYRTDNEPFKFYMQNFTTKIVNMLKEEGLYASQGGPIILSQIENEYQNVERAFGTAGSQYVEWAVKMAVGLNTGVPWVMCKQTDAPDPVDQTLLISLQCGQRIGHHLYGGLPYIRSAEDIAFHVALFVARNGSFINYYMYHGGTNFGRTASAYTITGYYDQAPLDEYGLFRQPKYGHLKELHAAIKSCSTTLLQGVQRNFSLGELQEGYVFEEENGGCVALLINNDKGNNVTIQFRNSSYDLLPKSISILPDCQNVAFNTANVSTTSNRRIITSRQNFSSVDEWQQLQDVIPNFDDTSLRSNSLLEQMNTTKDT
ncbi:hypothetical protein KIW84_022358 [Lathyrus oleraceus]|uniref:beta-galactosidase n=1 Tax=Pisum sativum TaxID=3888 RepID=A0A9D4YES0_PEA|nr:hypothetical protein KIW84_022358 [Pisum sativum]